MSEDTNTDPSHQGVNAQDHGAPHGCADGEAHSHYRPFKNLPHQRPLTDRRITAALNIQLRSIWLRLPHCARLCGLSEDYAWQPSSSLGNHVVDCQHSVTTRYRPIG